MIKKAVSPTMTTIKTLDFPARFNRPCMRYKATIGIGGNIGNVIRRFEKLLHFLDLDRNVELMATGSILKNPPFGFTNQDDFYNSVMQISTNLTSEKLLQHLLRIEKKFGRKRSFKNAPRTLDIDLLFYENETKLSKNLILPHPHWQERESVILPLMDLGAVA